MNSKSHLALGYALSIAGRYSDAIPALRNAKALYPNDQYIDGQLAGAYYALGDYQSALEACVPSGEGRKVICLVQVYDKTGRHADAEAILRRIDQRHSPK